MKSCGVSYPTEIPVDCVREIVRIVRERRLLAERGAFAQHAWNVQGYLQRVLLGEPQPVIGAARSPTDESALAALVALEQQAIAQAEGSAVGALPVPVAMLLRWLVEKLLESLLRE